ALGSCNRHILKSKGWMKTKDVDTVWSIKFTKRDPNNEDDYKGIRNRLASVFIDAAKELKLKRIHYVAQLGNHEVIARVITKVDGEYKCSVGDL
ncbi:hypothetical protein QNL75_26145, partial [Pseudomonas amygdali pv. morsprunorum]|uniref:hypothetical protein n=1 Tax=Pseudomonas amygdali TaxID=47877 RepID=UPI00288CDF36